MNHFSRNLTAFVLLIAAFAPSIGFSSSLDKKVLRWAADTESGAPYVFNDPKNPAQLIGFEAEIVKALGEELEMDTEFVQNSWDGLIPGLNRREYDIAINGIEITEDRKVEIAFSEPYFATFLQLTVRKGTRGITTLSDLKGKKAGTLKSALSERILRAEAGVEVLTYENEFPAYQDLVNGRTDAVLLDAPIATYYASPNPALEGVGAPIGSMYYGIAMRKTDLELQARVNKALKKLIQNGKMREIMERWNLWNPLVAALFQDFSPSRTAPTSYQEFLKSTGQEKSFKEKMALYTSFLKPLGKGALQTIKISLASMVLAITFGLILALLKLYGPFALQIFSTVYVEAVRGTPLLIQLFFIFYALPNIGIKLSPFVAAVLGLGLNYAAYEAENYRAGILSVPRSQLEAALALGMSRWQALRHIILPQALRLVIPPVTNDFISLLKDSSLVSVITMVELTKVYGQLSSTYYDYFGTGIMVAAIYLLMGLPFVRLAKTVERRLSYEQRKVRGTRGAEPIASEQTTESYL